MSKAAKQTAKQTAKVEAPKLSAKQQTRMKAAAQTVAALLEKSSVAGWSVAEAIHGATKDSGKLSEADRKSGVVTLADFCGHALIAGRIKRRTAKDYRSAWTHYGSEAKRIEGLSFSDHVALIKASGQQLPKVKGTSKPTAAAAKRITAAASKSGRSISGQLQADARVVQQKQRSATAAAVIPSDVRDKGTSKSEAVLLRLAATLADGSNDTLTIREGLAGKKQTATVVLEGYSTALAAVEARAASLREAIATEITARLNREEQEKKSAAAKKEAAKNSKSVAAEREASVKRQTAKKAAEKKAAA